MYRFVTADRLYLDIKAKDQLEAYRKLTSKPCPAIIKVYWYMKGDPNKRMAWKLVYDATKENTE